MNLNANDFEQRHVHQVYDEIADHFSQTRYKTWPVVQRFIEELPKGSIGLDVGCGNGKNMMVRPYDIFYTGLDTSIALLKICHNHGYSTVAGSMISIPWRRNSLDFVICIAALHHLATKERRIVAIQEMTRILISGGILLFYVWAQEQPVNSSLYRHELTFLTKDKQDVLVPWTSGFNDGQMHQRYYHLFRKGELQELAEEAGGLSLIYSGYDKDNWYACFRKL